MEEKRKKENSTELPKPKVEVGIYNNNKKCDWGKKINNNKLKILTGFYSANKIASSNEGAGGGKWEKNTQKIL